MTTTYQNLLGHCRPLALMLFLCLMGTLSLQAQQSPLVGSWTFDTGPSFSGIPGDIQEHLDSLPSVRSSVYAGYTGRTLVFGAMVTTYAHRPMVGLSAVTDPRQETRYYTYDTANRLHTVTDGGSNLLQDYAYGYVEDTTVFGCTDVPDTPQPMLKVVDGVTDTGATYVTFRVTASGGNGTYAYAWYHGIGSSSSNFETVVAGNQDEFTLFVDCDEVQYVKLVVGSGTQELERVYANGNYPCLPGQDPENEE